MCVGDSIDLRPGVDRRNRALCKLMFVPHCVGCEMRMCHAFIALRVILYCTDPSLICSPVALRKRTNLLGGKIDG